MPGATIRIYLIEGTPLGPRTIEKSNWTGKTLDFARVDWPKMKARTDFGRPGVYLLTGFVALMDGLMPSWQLRRDELDRAPLAHEEWRY